MRGSHKFGCVGFQIIAADVALMIGLARRFKDKFGSRVILYVRSPEEVAGFQYLVREGVADEIIDCEKITPILREKKEGYYKAIERGCVWEKRLGETITRLSFEHRQLSRGFFTGGLGNPRSVLVERANYEQVVAAVCGTLDFWEKEIVSKEITLLVNAEKCGASVARWKGIPYRRVFSGKFDGDHFWSPSEYTELPSVEQTFLNLGEFESINVGATYKAQTAKLKRSWYLVSWRYIGISLVKAFTIGLYRSWFGSRRGSIRLLDTIFIAFRARSNFKRYKRLARMRMSDLQGTPYVYFPMHKEPETYMLVTSPEYFNQTAAIISLAKALPVGWRLVLKEHVPAFAFRDSDYYNRLLDIKNVVLVPVEESSHDLARGAHIVSTITGAAGLEASVFGVPTIQFGRHMINDFLPHVYTVGDDNRLIEFVGRVQRGEIDLSKARENGARFRSALDICCFKMPDFRVVKGTLSDSSIDAAFENLILGIKSFKS